MDLNQKITEQIDKFLLTEAWQVLKYRVLTLYAETMQRRIAVNLKMGDLNKAIIHQGMKEGAEAIIEITERLGGELMDKSLDADVALSVMENKSRAEVRGEKNG